MAFEIERKFLIEYPDMKILEKYPKSEIAQTYLKTDDGFTSRVRARTSDGVTKYIFTEKSASPTSNASKTSAKFLQMNTKSF